MLQKSLSSVQIVLIGPVKRQVRYGYTLCSEYIEYCDADARNTNIFNNSELKGNHYFHFLQYDLTLHLLT